MLTSLKDAKITNSKVILRVDYNVPVVNGVISNTTRIDQTLTTIEYLLKNNNTIILISHFGRPNGEVKADMSLEPVAKYLKDKFLNCEFITTPISLSLKDELSSKALGSLVLLENIRFYKQEEANDEEFARLLSSFADYYINDAFACIHRKHASIDKIQQFLPAYNGFLMEKETKQLTEFLSDPLRPYAAIIGGSKVSTKLLLLQNLAKKADYLLIGGAMANSFLEFKGYNVGNSLVEKGYFEDLKDLYKVASENNCEIILPQDFICAVDINASHSCIRELGDDLKSDAIFDIGPKTITLFKEILEKCATIVWNGPIGAFEYELFKNGTINLAEILSEICKQNNITVVAGGGDTISALDMAGVQQNLSYVSTGGGAFLYWLQST
jgi:phosphoglycerate kinase